jgi:exodeoxyribonuclease VII large subunit
VVDRAFPNEIWVQGEIRDLSRAPSGHVYFSLVDPGDDPMAVAPASLPVTLFASDKVAINRVLQRSGAGRFDDGVAVRIRGRLSHYGPRGTVQLRMIWIDTDYTLGRLAIERMRVVQALADDGLLDANAQVPFPLVPLRTALITSAGSAAHADFMEELAGSGIAFEIDLFDTRVQGVEAEASLLASLDAARSAQVIAIVRGGGSRTDLAAFDREVVARAVATAAIPVVVGIGHEIDETVVDRVAARSYRTPTACAAGLVAEVSRFLQRLDGVAAAISNAARRRLVRVERDLAAAGGRAGRAASQRLRHASSYAAALDARVDRAARRLLDISASATTALGRRIAGAGRQRTNRAAADLDLERTRLVAAEHALDRAQARIETIAATTAGLDPQRVLARGWTLTTDERGHIVRTPNVLDAGDRLITVFSSGRAVSIVDTVEAGESGERQLSTTTPPERSGDGDIG